MANMISSMIANRQNFLPPTRDEGPSGGQIVSSTAWSGIGIVATSILQVVRSMIFARLLMPEDFGVLSLANVFTQFILIFANFGFSSSVIYHKELDRNDLSTCWWSNLGIDTITAATCVLVAFINSRLSDDPTIAYVICLLAFQFVIISFGNVNNSLLRRMFKFRETALINFMGALASFGMAWFLVAAYQWGVYGLVGGMIFGNLVMTIMNFLFLPWLPSFSFSRPAFQRHFSYGRWFLGVNLVTFVNGSVDRVVVGTLLNRTQLGFYEYAANVPLMVVDMLARMLNNVLFSAFSSLQDKPQELMQLLVRVYRYNSLLVFPLLAGVGLVAHDFILVAYSEKWLPILVPLRIFCLVGILQLYTRPLYILCNGIGKPNWPFRWALIFLPINLVLLYIGVKAGGTPGVVAVRLILPLFMMATLGVQVMKEIQLAWRRIYIATLPAVIGSLLMGLVVIAIQQSGILAQRPPLPRLLVLVLLGGCTYLGFMLLFFRKDLLDLKAYLRKSA